MPRYSLLLIDMDDTLFDFRASQEHAFGYACEESGVPDPAAALECYNRVNEALWRRFEMNELTHDELNAARFASFFEAYGQPGDAPAFGRRYMDLLGAAGRLAPGALALVKAALVEMPVTIVTNGYGKTQRARLNASELAGLPISIIVSEEAGAAKPDPLMIREAMRMAGVTDPSRVIMAGDSLTSDIGAAKAAGVASCWVNRTGAKAPDDLRPDYQVESLDQLRDILELDNSGAFE
ncbi:MAG: YjjG family noncanonical pyrimidine nucleotidase [Oscillospiraceae bacterium]|jgi:2-haloacid dehalogenase|nr:YjjG family noncanonical pyrimidine nucleotidase [Oscillospiraceae bacterium]